jgi:hypothetical protein
MHVKSRKPLAGKGIRRPAAVGIDGAGQRRDGIPRTITEAAGARPPTRPSPAPGNRTSQPQRPAATAGRRDTTGDHEQPHSDHEIQPNGAERRQTRCSQLAVPERSRNWDGRGDFLKSQA